MIIKILIHRKLLIKVIEKFLIILFISAIAGNSYILLLKSYYNKIYKTANHLRSIEGIIVSNKEEKEYTDKYIIKSKKINNSKFIIYVKKNKRQLKYGDKIKFVGEYIEPEGRRNYRGFYYKEYLKTKKICGTFKVNGNIEIIKQGNPLNIFFLTNQLRQKIIKNAQQILPKDVSQVLLGVLLGEKSGITEEDKENFRLSGMSHILAVSGMHTSYVILGLTYIFAKLPKKRKYILLIIFLVFFMFLTNFTPSVVRAVIMSIMMIISKLMYRKNDTINALFLSCLILLLYNPYLIKNIGLILSFLGTLGIVLFIKTNLPKTKIRKNSTIYNILSVSVSAQILIFPIIIYYFNVISFSFFISSFICSFLVGIIFIYGLANLSISFISIKIAKILSPILKVLLIILISSAKFIASIKILNLTVPTPSEISIIIYYVLIYILYKLKSPKDNLRRYEKKMIKYIQTNMKKIIAIFVILSIIQFAYKPLYYAINKDIVIHFIDVGQGDSMLVISPKGKTILIDTGEDKELVLSYLLDRGIRKVDYILISHFDTDHVGGLVNITENLKVNNVIIGKQVENSENLQYFLETVKKTKTKVNVVEKGQTLFIEDNLYIYMLWPDSNNIINKNLLNNNSLVCKLCYKEISILLTGDIEKEAEEAILDTYRGTNILNSTILKVAHHGSNTSSIKEFLEAIDPKIALIGVGKNNKFGHPNKSVIEKLRKKGVKILRTDEQGEITLINMNILKKENIKISNFAI